MKRVRLIILLIAAFAGVAHAQPGSKKAGSGKMEPSSGDTLDMIVLSDVSITPKEQVQFMTTEEKKEWDLMVWRVDKVYPMVHQFLTDLTDLDSQIAATDKKSKKRKIIKAEQDKLKEQFEEKLKNLSYQQGEVVINMLHKYTGRTAYDLIRDYKSGFTAGSYQLFARVNGLDLKDTFDPNSDEDQLLNKVLIYRGL